METEVQTYGVYQHSSGPRGGFVVRTLYNDWCPSPYNHAKPVKVYARQYAAQNYADKLNGGQ